MNFQNSITNILNTKFNVTFCVNDNVLEPFCCDVDTSEVVVYCRNLKIKKMETKNETA